MDLGMFFFISGLIVVVVSFVLWMVIEAKYSKGGSHVSVIEVAGMPVTLGVILMFISVLITPDMSLVKDYNNAVKEGYTFYKDGNAVQKPEALGIDKNNINSYKIKIDDKKKEVFVVTN